MVSAGVDDISNTWSESVLFSLKQKEKNKISVFDGFFHIYVENHQVDTVTT